MGANIGEVTIEVDIITGINRAIEELQVARLAVLQHRAAIAESEQVTEGLSTDGD